jgi:hypothetical protein
MTYIFWEIRIEEFVTRITNSGEANALDLKKKITDIYHKGSQIHSNRLNSLSLKRIQDKGHQSAIKTQIKHHPKGQLQGLLLKCPLILHSFAIASAQNFFKF